MLLQADGCCRWLPPASVTEEGGAESKRALWAEQLAGSWKPKGALVRLLGFPGHDTVESIMVVIAFLSLLIAADAKNRK